MLQERHIATSKTKSSESFFYGVSEFLEEFDAKIRFFKVPISSPRPPVGDCSATGSFWYLSAVDQVERRERQSLLLEDCDRLRAHACVINVPPSFAIREDLRSRVNELAAVFRQRGKCPIYFDFGKAGPPNEFIRNDLIRCVSDPLWHRGKVWSDYWKIHGWHPERWVRKYPNTELKKLAKLAGKHKPRFLMLAHSQRIEQYFEITRELSIRPDCGKNKGGCVR